MNKLSWHICTVSLLLSSLASATDGPMISIGSGNVGLGQSVQLGDNSTTAITQLISRAESVSVRQVEGSSSEHWLIADSKFFVMGGAGQTFFEQNASTPYDNVFRLKLVGNVSAGLQAYKVIPLNLSVEDITLETGSLGNRKNALLGSTIYLPVAFGSEDAQSSLLLFAFTGGARFNNQVGQTPFGVQPKVKFISKSVSAELRYMSTLGADQQEQKAAADIAYISSLSHHDTFGVSFSQSWIEQNGSHVSSGPEIMIYYAVGL